VAFIPSGGTGFPQPISPALTGDFNSDGLVNNLDIDRLAWAAQNEPQNLVYDLNDDSTVNFIVSQSGTIASDSDVLIRQVLMTEYGDLNLNRQVSPSDLAVLSGNYRKAGQFGWADGNINGSQQAGTLSSPRITASDLAILIDHYRFGIGGGGAAAAIAVIPEPGTWLLSLCAVIVGISARSGRRRKSA
jgi:hypothetical protein